MKAIILIISVLCLSACAHKGKKGCSHKKHGHSHKARMWDKMDADKDGVVTKKEFDAMKAEKFKAWDANSDGKVTKDEMMAHCKKKKAEKKKACCGS